MSYYTLVTSLPYLPRFDRADRLPINWDRLQERLKMLDPGDAEAAGALIGFLRWDRQSPAETHTKPGADLDQIEEMMRDRRLRAVLEFPIALRTILSALRRRRRGLAGPKPGERWGLGRWVEYVERNWDEPDFGLGVVLPWVARARECIETGDMLALDHLLMGLVWDQVGRLTEGHEFEFRGVLAYLVKWDILQRWLSRDKKKAGARIEELLTEVIGEHNQLLA